MTRERATRVLRMLALTESDNDHEALSAMRQVNRIRLEERLNWPLFLAALLSPAPAARPERPRPPQKENGRTWTTIILDEASDESFRQATEEMGRAFDEHLGQRIWEAFYGGRRR